MRSGRIVRAVFIQNLSESRIVKENPYYLNWFNFSTSSSIPSVAGFSIAVRFCTEEV
jgi:hypothetical protein